MYRTALDRYKARRQKSASLDLNLKIQETQQKIRELEKKLNLTGRTETPAKGVEKSPSGQFTQGHAVIVGVGADLPVTVEDGKAIAEILYTPGRCAYPGDQVQLLTNSAATRASVLSALDTLARSVSVDSTAIVYFSGHGYHIQSPKLPENFYLLPYEYDLDDLPGTGISGTEFTTKLRAIHAKKLLILLDCCHAGGIAQPKAPGMIFSKSPLPLQTETILAEGSGRVILASSRADEKSYTGNPYSHFTLALLEALAGAGASEKDGYARVLDIALYVGRMVPNRTNDAQHPILKISNLENNFVLAYYAGGAKEPLLLPKRGETQPQVTPLPIDSELEEGYRNLLNKYRHNLLEIEMRMAEFIDQRAVPLDLLKAREGVIKKIEELEKG